MMAIEVLSLCTVDGYSSSATGLCVSGDVIET
jgi:hypothetical protein